MLTIREAQLRAFSVHRTARFVDEMVQHIHASLPDHYAALRDDGTRAAVERVVVSAGHYGLTSEDCAACFIRLAFLFDEDFHKQQPWAVEALRVRDGDTEFDRTARLAEAAMAHLKQAAGLSE